MDTFTRLQDICKANGTTPTALCKIITGSSGNLATWKKGNIRADYLQKIADYFNVSVDYLLTGAKETPTAESDERKDELMRLFSLLDDAGRDALIAVAQNMKKQDQ